MYKRQVVVIRLDLDLGTLRLQPRKVQPGVLGQLETGFDLRFLSWSIARVSLEAVDLRLVEA